MVALASTGDLSLMIACEAWLAAENILEGTKCLHALGCGHVGAGKQSGLCMLLCHNVLDFEGVLPQITFLFAAEAVCAFPKRGKPPWG